MDQQLKQHSVVRSFLLISFILILVIIVSQFMFALRMNKIIEKTVIDQVEITNIQTEKTIYQKLNDVRRTGITLLYNEGTQRYMLEDDIHDKYEQSFLMDDNIKNVTSLNKDLYDILFINETSEIISFTAMRDSLGDSDFIDDFNTLLDSEDSLLFKPIDNYYQPMFAMILKKELQPNNTGVIMICKRWIISDVFTENEFYDGSSITISLNEDEIFSRPELLDNAATVDTSMEFPEYGVIVQISTPIDKYTDEYRFVNRSIIYILACGLLLVFCLMMFTRQSILKPINKLVESIKRLNDGERLAVHTNNEFGFISSNINMMLDKIDKMTEYKLEQQRKEHLVEMSKWQAELLALQNQIGSHFLYNTFESIQGIAKIYKTPVIGSIIQSVTKIFRTSSNVHVKYTLKEEIGLLREYMNIMNIRYEKDFIFKVDVDEKLYNCKIPKLILQPIIENAILHGVFYCEGVKEVKLNAESFDNSLIITVSDNGEGIDEEKVDYINELLQNTSDLIYTNQKNNIALQNIQTRIKYHCGEGYGVVVKSKINIGTDVIITLPVE